jgi:hypothetical protein
MLCCKTTTVQPHTAHVRHSSYCTSSTANFCPIHSGLDHKAIYCISAATIGTATSLPRWRQSTKSADLHNVPNDWQLHDTQRSKSHTVFPAANKLVPSCPHLSSDLVDIPQDLNITLVSVMFSFNKKDAGSAVLSLRSLTKYRYTRTLKLSSHFERKERLGKSGSTSRSTPFAVLLLG